ncbi:DUF4396 domain-containing protein [Agilicoccus flavus]|uniref:DUF4396 domain-containing protein n=1 Tax=Agilicoccus flavus TaxID=2775968 RepID=UPI001CF68CDE|nr:DUF4396 domain-containing protein [Agilicoccus flavus]
MGITHAEHDHHDMSGMAVGATLHCLTGCAIGEIVGLMVGTALGWATLPTTALAIGLAFVFGYSLSALPLVRGGIALGSALSLVLAADTLSIATMEVVDNAVMLLVPGAMDAGLTNPLFWVSMAIALLVAFFAALPVNRYLLRRGKGHAITHGALGHGAPMDNRPLAFGIAGFLLGGFAAAVGSLL